MNMRKLLLAFCLFGLYSVFLAPVATAAVVPSPAWKIESLPLPTNFVPEDETTAYYYEVRAVDITGAPLGGGLVTLTDTLPAKLSVKKVEFTLGAAGASSSPPRPGEAVDAASVCETETKAEVSTVTCKVLGKIGTQPVSREAMTLKIFVKTPAAALGPLSNFAEVQGGGAGATSTTSHNAASTETATSGLAGFHTEITGPNGTPATQAASHPYQFTTSFLLNTEAPPGRSPVPAQGDLKDIHLALPPGLVGNPTATARCTQQQFSEISTEFVVLNACPPGSVVGVIDALAEDGIRLSAPIYNLVPPLGMPVQLGFHITSFPFFVNFGLGAGPEYPIVSTLQNLTEIERPVAARVTIWGAPNDPSHDRQRGGACLAPTTGVSIGSCAAGEAVKPFLRMPTGCQASMTSNMRFSTWPDPGTLLGAISTLPAPEQCSILNFKPTLVSQPQTTVSDSPSGLHVELQLPQNEDPELLATADLRNTTVDLPEGVSINPASAAGLAACSPAQIDLRGIEPARCPDASKVGSVELKTPLLDHPVKGSIYVATQNDNPFGSLVALYIALNDPQTGTVVKLAGKVTPDPLTGRLSATFSDTPQFPFEKFSFDFFNGPRAPLRTPQTCGTYATTTNFQPWSAPESGPAATPSDSFTVALSPGGGACAPTVAQLPHHPSFQAGSTIPFAGSYSPFNVQLRREDGSQNLSGLSVTLPKGLAARFTGVPYCPETSIAAAAARSHPGDGALELISPSCPAASQLGTVTVAAGAGTAPLQTQGKVYFAGPYKGAPLSLVTITPAIAGPFDLGVVVVRAALYVDPQTAQGSVVSDPLPTILAGIPLDVRSVSVAIDRNSYTINPTSCDATAVTGQAISTTGQVAPLSDRFQLGGCKGLDFTPKISLTLKGGTRRSQNPALRAVLTQPSGQANSSRITVTLPVTEFIDPDHINNPCTRVQFSEEKCPAKSILGVARVFTPLFNKPLEGKIYFRSNGGERELPDAVAVLDGQVRVVLVGFIDAAHRKGSEESRIRSTFTTVPDAPVTKAVIELKGGKKDGVLVNSRNLCAKTYRAQVKMTAHNGKVHDFQPVVHNSCSDKRQKK
jgi:hypothetical protein